MLKIEPSLTEEKKNNLASYLVVVFTIFGFNLNQNKKNEEKSMNQRWE
jgi:hypothetical protein